MSVDLRSLGIEVVPSLQEASSWDYELLYLPAEVARNSGICEHGLNADKLRVSLPKRVVVGGMTEADTIYATTTKTLHIPDESASIKDNQNVLLQVYDEWISFLMQRRGLDGKKLSLSFFFENLQTVSGQWKLEDTDRPPFISLFDPFCGNSADAFRKMKEQDYSNGIFLWRHVKLSRVPQKVKKKMLYFQKCTYGDPFFAYLSSVNPRSQGFQAQYLLRQIVEMALCRVVIVDERIARVVAANDNPDPTQSLAHALAWMGIWVVGCIEFRKNGRHIRTIVDGEEVNASFPIGAHPNASNGLVKLKMDYTEGRFITTIRYPLGIEEDFPPVPPKIEIMTVHQTILDGKLKAPLVELFDDKTWGENWCLEMKPGVPFVYIHSGRGHLREILPANSLFLDYSFLQTHILSQPSKFFFVQLALASKEENKVR